MTEDGKRREDPDMPVILQSIPTDWLLDRWRRDFGIDVAPLFTGVARIELRRDPETGLELFDPPVAGNAALYVALQERSWYYLDDKWEYDRALSTIMGPERILEIGCGQGAFLRKAAARGHQCIGLELNPEAAAKARDQGLDVRTDLLEPFLTGDAGGFDRVVSFQVLEHVADPFGLLQQMAAAVRPGGRVCFAVPNNDSFIGGIDNILDMPPHHLSRWRPESIRRIGGMLGARDVTVAESPLEPVHYDWYLQTRMGSVPGKRLILNPLVRRAAAILFDFGLARRIKGHSVYAEFRF